MTNTQLVSTIRDGYFILLSPKCSYCLTHFHKILAFWSNRKLKISGIGETAILDSILLAPYTKGCCLTIYPSMKETCSTELLHEPSSQQRIAEKSSQPTYLGVGKATTMDPYFSCVLPVGMLDQMVSRHYICVNGEWGEKMGNSGGMEE